TLLYVRPTKPNFIQSPRPKIKTYFESRIQRGFIYKLSKCFVILRILDDFRKCPAAASSASILSCKLRRRLLKTLLLVMWRVQLKPALDHFGDVFQLIDLPRPGLAMDKHRIFEAFAVRI